MQNSQHGYDGIGLILWPINSIDLCSEYRLTV